MAVQPQQHDDTGTAFGWDQDRIEKPNEGGGGFTLIPEGVYSFTVKKWERGYFDGSPKMCACPKAILTLEIDAGELGLVEQKKDLFLNRKVEGILCAFFTCIGLRKHGDPLVLAWNQIPGTSGRCKIGHRRHEGKDYNEIKAWLEPENAGNGNGAKPPIPF